MSRPRSSAAPLASFARRTVVLAGCALPLAANGGGQATTRVSVATAGTQSNSFSSDLARNRPSISADGRFVAFESQATNLVPSDTNGTSDIFVRDRTSGVTTRISTSTGGVQATADCSAPEITPDGRFVLFTSAAANLVAGDTNNSEDVFVHDRQTGTTVCVSVTPSGVTGAGTSGPGSANSYYRRPISADGRYVAFTSNAANLVAGDGNFAYDVFVRDLAAASTTRASVDASGAQANDSSSGPSLSSDARWLAFESRATNLVAGDTNATTDVFVKDLMTGAIVRASTNVGGVQGNFISYDPSLSNDGRVVAFLSAANNLVAGDTNSQEDVFVKYLDTGVVVRANVRPDTTQSSVFGEAPMLSRDGRSVAFTSWDALALGDLNGLQDIFVRDLALGVTHLISVDSLGMQADARSLTADLTSDALAVAYASYATNLVASDTNNKSDVFVCDRALADPLVFCVAKSNSLGCTPSIHFSGTPTLGPGSFTISANSVLNQRNGLLFYGLGATALPYFGGTLCAAPPLHRTPVQNSLGNPPPDDCTGHYAFDMHAYLASGIDPSLVVGARVVAQFWSRDSASTFHAGLTDAVAFTVCP